MNCRVLGDWTYSVIEHALNDAFWCLILQALCTAVTEQNLLKTVTQLFAEAEAARLSDSNGHEKHLSLNYSYTQAAGSQDLLTHKHTLRITSSTPP